MNPKQQDELSRAFYSALGARLHKEQTIERLAIVLPSQRGIDYGSRWLRLVPDRRSCHWQYESRHYHWGRVLTVREYALGRLEAGDSPEEIEDNIERLRMRHARGWRLSEVHCDACGQAELQSVPMASVWPVRPVEYGMAKADHFNGRHLREQAWFRSLRKRYRVETTREAEAAQLDKGAPLFVQVDEGDK